MIRLYRIRHYLGTYQVYNSLTGAIQSAWRTALEANEVANRLNRRS